MTETSWPSQVSGAIQAPPSKSVAQRAFAIASMTNGSSRIINPGQSDDVLVAIDVCRKLGASIHWDGELWHVKGGMRRPLAPLNCGESGLSARMFAGIASTFSEEVRLTGRGSLMKRPMEVTAKSLQALGAQCSTTQGKLPLYIKGPVQGGHVQIDGSQGSQVLTGILLAAPLAKNDLHLHVHHLKSKPYIDLTVEMMQKAGVEIFRDGYKDFFIPCGQTYSAGEFQVEGDWSGASFFLVAGAIAGEVVVYNLRMDSTQGDKRILEALEASGAVTSCRADKILAAKGELKAFSFDATDCPDLFPPLVALAAHCSGTSRIQGVNRLRTKESDRATTLTGVFSNMGIDIRIDQDIMCINGGKPIATRVHSHGDHRIAMASAVTALGGQGPVSIEQAEVVNKSYPGFFDELVKIKE